MDPNPGNQLDPGSNHDNGPDPGGKDYMDPDQNLMQERNPYPAL